MHEVLNPAPLALSHRYKRAQAFSITNRCVRMDGACGADDVDDDDDGGDDSSKHDCSGDDVHDAGQGAAYRG